MVETTFELPVIDISIYLKAPSSESAAQECKRAADALLEYSACSILDPRVSENDNSAFLDLLENYFNQSTDVKLKDVHPELFYQVGATPENIEFPRCSRDPKCLGYVDALSSDDKPLDFNQKDPKWRFFWRMGQRPLETKFQQLNAPSVEPKEFPQWKSEMDKWGNFMLSAIETLSEMIAIGFNMPVDTFTKLLKYGPHLLAPTGSDLIKYGQIGRVLAGFHTDLNFLTIHGKSRFPGLHIWTPEGKKLLVKIRDGCLLVQAGKQMEWLTGGSVKAGFHEVAIVPETLIAIENQKLKNKPLWRISSTLFSHVGSDEILKPMHQFSQSAEASKYLEICAGDQVEEELKFISLANQ